MKKITLALLILFTANTFSQQIYLEAGNTLSSFDYKNSQGERLDNLQASSHSFMTIGYRNQVFTENLNISLGTSYAGYGAIGSDDSVGNYMEWDLNYLQINVGLDYELLKINNLQFYIKGSSSVAFLLQGTQTLNNRVINLNNQDLECDLDYIPNTARESEINIAMSNSFGFGGTNGTLIFKRM
jgi:hypothetical protein